MSGGPSFYITRSTTLLQIDSSISINAIVYLSSLNSPGALITIRDIAGAINYNSTAPPASNNIITLSTTQGITFLDGGGPSNNIYRITQPYGFLTVIPKTSSIWGVLNTFAFPDATAAANIQNLTASSITVNNSYLTTAYISTAAISTITIASIQTPQLTTSSLIASTTTSFYTTTNILQTSSILASTLTSVYTYSPVIQTSSILASTVTSFYTYSPVIETSSILASTVTSFYTYSPVIQTSSILASTIFVPQIATSSILASTITASIASPQISASNITVNATSSQARWVAVGNITGGGSTIHYSNDGGIIWFPADNTFITGGLGVAWNGSIWVAVGNDDTSPYTIKWSTDGITWTNASTTLGDGLFSFIGWSIAWNGSMWMAGGSDSAGKTLKYSYDGNVWMNTNYITSAIFTIAWNGYMWVAGKQSSPAIIYSYDGINWFSDTTNSFDTACNGITWNGSIWVAAGDDTTWRIKYSYDGKNWNNAIGGFNGIGYGVAWNGKMFVAVGQDSVACMKYSYDGINWQNSSSGVFNIRGRNIAWGGSVWVAVGQDSANNTIKYSYDGINWQDKSGGAVELTLGYGIAYSSPLTPDISSRGLNMYLQSQPVFLSSTNQILATLSSIVINNTLYVDKTSNRVGINIPPNANYTLDVNGPARITNLTSPQIATSSILASTVTSFYTYSPVIQTSSILASTITASIASPQISASNIIVNSTSSQARWVACGYGGFGSTILYSNDGGLTWLPGNNAFGYSAYGVAWNGSIWVALGSDDFSSFSTTIKWSTDGITWTNASSTLGDGLFATRGYSIAWNGSIWVAGGADSTFHTLKYSYDGNVWMNTNYLSPGILNAIVCIAWNGYMWIAGDELSPRIIYSYDGINWLSATTNPFDIACNGIAWNGRLWVSVGNDNTSFIKYSYDGINWNNAIGGFNGPGFGVAWNGKMFVAVGRDSTNNTINYSYDGINWYSNTTNAFNYEGTKIAWGGSVWIAVGQDSANNTIKYSYNGINWQNSSSGIFSAAGTGIAYSSPLTPDISSRGLNMYLQSQPVFLSSTNQILATSSTIVMNNTLYVDKTSNRVGINVSPNANYTLDVNGSTRITNLTTPQIATSSVLASTLTSFYTYTNNLQTSSVLASTLQAYGNVNVVSDSPQKLWIAVGQGSPAIRYSSDGIVWNNATGNVFNNSAYGVAWNGSMWVAVGEFSGGSTIRFSYDGITWNRATVGIFGGYGYGVAWNGRIWVAVGDEGGLTTTIKYSNDGIIWNDVSSAGFTDWGSDIAWNGSMWVAVGTGGGSTIKYSYDGLTWNNASSGEFSSFGAGIAWNGALWVAVGAGGGSTIKYSYDGINWNSCSGLGGGVFSNSGLGVAWNGSIWVAVGNGGSIKYSRDGIIWYNSSSSGDGLFSGYALGISWNGSLWVAAGFGGGATIKYSKDGIVWSNAGGSIFINEGFGVANNYSVLPDYSAKELNLYLKGQPVFLSSTNQILATLSTIVVNNTLYVDKTLNRVGINVAPNDNYTLDVNGNVRASTVTVTGICYAQQFVTVSDAIAKTNICEWTSSAIDTLAQIRPYSFNYIGGVESIGLLAQEVESVYPQLIQERGSTKYVNYDGVVALLLKAVKELAGHMSSLQGSGSPIHPY